MATSEILLFPISPWNLAFLKDPLWFLKCNWLFRNFPSFLFQCTSISPSMQRVSMYERHQCHTKMPAPPSAFFCSFIKVYGQCFVWREKMVQVLISACRTASHLQPQFGGKRWRKAVPGHSVRKNPATHGCPGNGKWNQKKCNCANWTFSSSRSHCINSPSQTEIQEKRNARQTRAKLKKRYQGNPLQDKYY